VLVDSSVWVDYLSRRQTPLVDVLDRALGESRLVATTGVILQEILQGARTERTFQLLRSRFSRLAYLPASKQTFVAAAVLHRKARGRGMTVPTVDTLIASTAIAHGAALLTADDHFRTLASVSKLRLVSP
jgi:hypothetical protein